MIPTIAQVRIETPHWRTPGLWLPLILLWIPVLLLSPLILLVILGACIAGRISPWRTIAVLWGILSSLPGTSVRVCADGNRVQVRIL
jgi:hypothetical protein